MDRKKDLGIDNIFSVDTIYTDHNIIGRDKIKTWFNEWNTRGDVIIWEIEEFFHKENKTIVTWLFKCKMYDGIVEEFNGITLIKYFDDKIAALREYGSNIDNYDPYKLSDKPVFKEENIKWF